MTIGSWSQPLLGTSNPEFPAGAQAVAAEVNQAGGLNGRQLEVIACSDELNPEVARQCAREAVRLGVVAVVGLQTFNETAVLPVLEAAGIPAIGVYPFTDSALTNPISFPLTSGFMGQNIGMGLQLARHGAAKIRVVVPGGMGAISTEISRGVERGARAGNATYAGLVQIPARSLDLSPVVAAATADDASVAGLAVDEAELVRSVRALAPKAMIATFPFNLTDNVLRSTGSRAEGVLSVEGFLPPSADVPGTRLYRRQLQAFAPSLPVSATGLHEWLAMRTFVKVASRLSSLTPRNLLAAMNEVRDLDMEGLTPPFSARKQPGRYSRLFNSTVVFQTVRSGRIVLNDGQASPFVEIGPLLRANVP